DFSTVEKTVLRWYGDIPASLKTAANLTNPKGRLQELVQPKLGNEAISYEISSVEGEAHNRSFEVQLFIDKKLAGTGRGKTKKEAEEKAATQALQSWLV